MDERENWPSVRRPSASVREGLHEIRSRTDAMDADGIMEVEGGPQRRRRRRRRGTQKRIVRATMIGKSQQQEEKDFNQETL